MLGVHSLSVYVDVHLVVLTFFVLFSFPSSLPSPLSFSLRWLCTSLRSLVVLSIVPRFFVLLRPPFRRQQMIFVRMITLGSIKRGGLVATRNTSPHHRHQQHNHHHHHHRHHDQHHRPPPPPCPLRGHLHLWTVLLSCLSIVRFVCIGGCIGLVRLH